MINSFLIYRTPLMLVIINPKYSCYGLIFITERFF